MKTVAALTVIAVALIGASTTNAHSFGIKLIASTDDAARVTQECQRENNLPIKRNPRNYAKPHSRGFRKEAHRRWHNRRQACQTYARHLGVPTWFWNLMMCIHPWESSNWYLDTHHDGGLQFHPDTWDAGGGEKYAEYAYQATPAQQIRVAWNLTKGSWKSLRWHWKATIWHCA